MRPPSPPRRAALATAALAVVALLACSYSLSAAVSTRPRHGARVRGSVEAAPRALPRRAGTAARSSAATATTTASLDADLAVLIAGGGAASGVRVGTATGAVNAAASAPPPWFDSASYLTLNPDLPAAGITDAAAAEAHYVAAGRAEGRAARPLDITLRYTACGGLINQHYSHVSALALASAVDATRVHLPPAVQRSSYGHYFSVFADQNEVKWTPAPLAGVLDVDAATAAWAERGVQLLPPVPGAELPDVTRPATAFPTTPLPTKVDGRPTTHARVDSVYMASSPLPSLADRVRVTPAAAVTPALRVAPDARPPPIVVDLPCTFFAVRTADSLPLVTDVARTLTIAPDIIALADRVVAAVASAALVRPPPRLRDRRAGDLPLAPFNGAHLRLESDARDWTAILGGPAALWGAYVGAARAAGCDAHTPLFIASGLLSYGATAQLAAVVAEIKRLGLASAVYHKEMFLGAGELEALTSEQAAAVDFVVLARAKGFVGLGSSTFSHYIREHRALHGVTRSTSALVNASAIGTDALFAAAGTVV